MNDSRLPMEANEALAGCPIECHDSTVQLSGRYRTRPAQSRTPPATRAEPREVAELRT